MAVLHVVAQEIEAELVVGAVGDVRPVGVVTRPVVHVVLDDANGESQRMIDRTHPLGVAPRQVIVHRDHVHALAREAVQVHGQGGDQGLALTRFHLRDTAFVQYHAAHQLHVEVPHVEQAPGDFPRHGKGIRQQTVERRAIIQLLPEGMGAAAQVVERQVRQR